MAAGTPAQPTSAPQRRLATLPSGTAQNGGRRALHLGGGLCSSGSFGSVGGIVGGVIGGLLLIVIIVTVACCLAKKQAYRGRVIGAATIAATSNVTVVQTTTTSGVQQYPGMYSYGPFGGSAPPPPPSLQPLPSYYSSSSQGIAAPAMPAYAFPPTYSTAPGYTPFVKAPNY
ncbi:hypothetical protein C0Q70_14997 [Pomacea canaliculata]|uniref:Cysteine and tyrosine-rich protein 1 n=1 Tax=Pomacea canaliculata TaxID=400727 RepID=A0A2T7NTN2_POMCA|nr:hypothetical protein C0Q70_14997 [Pomacea canaliculata]